MTTAKKRKVPRECFMAAPIKGEGNPVGMMIWPPRECPICHVMRCLLVNRHGKTLCLSCDSAKVQP